jgi:hypothetical protein
MHFEKSHQIYVNVSGLFRENIVEPCFVEVERDD